MDKAIIEAIDYIKSNLSQELRVEDIARHCHFSQYYFNRRFKRSVGESVYSFIKRNKIEKSAFDITRTRDESITRIAADYGYTSSNYSTAFKRHYGISPIHFKRDMYKDGTMDMGKGFSSDLREKGYEYYRDNMTMVYLNDMHVIYRRIIGNYRDLSEHWNSFLMENQRYLDKDSLLLDVSYDDPFLTEPSRCITDICMTTMCELEIGCNSAIISGGCFLKYRYQGSKLKIFEAYQGLLYGWFRETRYKVDFNRKVVCIYDEVNERDDFFSLDICIPINRAGI